MFKFLKAARNLVNQGMSKEAIEQFARNEFGEINELFQKQIDNLFKQKQGIENIKIKDEVFDDTIVKLPIDDTGAPFNPKDPMKQYGKPKKSKKMTDVEEAIDNASPGFAGDRKYDAQLVADDLAEKRFGKDFYDLDQKQQTELYGEAFDGLSKQKQVQRESLEDFVDDAGGVNPDDPRGIDDFIPDPEDMAQGGIAGYYTGGMVDVEPSLSDIGHGSDALMARTRLVSPNSQATTSTGLNYLLAEDNDNIRVPFENGLKVYPKIMASKSNQGLGDGKNVDLQDLTYGGTLMYDQGPFSAGIEYLKGKDKFDFKDKDDTLFKDTTDRELANLILMMKLKNGSIKLKGNKDNQMINFSKSFADGGRIGFSKGKLADAARRKFMKTAGGIGAGIAALKTGLLGLGEKAAPVVETAVETAKGIPPYFFQLVDVIKSKGQEIKSYGERVKQYITPSKDGKSELMLTEDLNTGDIQIKKIYKENDEMVTKSEEMNFTKGRGDESTKGTPADDYEEVTEFNSRIYKDEFNDPDVVEGIDVEEIVKEIDVKKASGGIAQMIGE